MVVRGLDASLLLWSVLDETSVVGPVGMELPHTPKVLNVNEPRAGVGCARHDLARGDKLEATPSPLEHSIETICLLCRLLVYGEKSRCCSEATRILRLQLIPGYLVSAASFVRPDPVIRGMRCWWDYDESSLRRLHKRNASHLMLRAKPQRCPGQLRPYSSVGHLYARQKISTLNST